MQETGDIGSCVVLRTGDKELVAIGDHDKDIVYWRVKGREEGGANMRMDREWGGIRDIIAKERPTGDLQ